MAAAEYYNPNSAYVYQGPILGPASVPQPAPTQNQLPRPPPNQNQPPQPARPNTSSGQAPPYPMSELPPPYSTLSPGQPPQRASSQPPPQQYQPYNPNAPRPNVDTHQYPPDKLPQTQRPSTLQNMSRPSDYAASYPPPQQPQYPPQQGLPQNGPNPYANQTGMYQQVGPGLGSLSQVYGTQRPPRRSSTSGASPGRQDIRRDSRSRSRSRDRRNRKHHHSSRPTPPQRQKSGGVNTFLGAGGGAIIGDLIFPGLGTVGGAILGGVGGHEYGKKRASSNPSKGGRKKGEFYEDEYRREERRGRK